MLRLFTIVENLQILELKRVEGVDFESIFVEMESYFVKKSYLQMFIIFYSFSELALKYWWQISKSESGVLLIRRKILMLVS